MSGIVTDLVDPEGNEDSQNMTRDETVGTEVVNLSREPTAEEGVPRQEPTGRTHGRPNVCLVCNLLTMNHPGSVWVQPCRCGYWVHDQCLVEVAMLFEDYNPGTRTIGCTICKRTYNISPVKSYFQKYLEKCFNVWYLNICYVAMETFSVIVSDLVFIKLGVFVLKKVYGQLHTARLVSSMTPQRAILTCQLIPVSCIVVSCIPWEHILLKVLRKCSRLPVIGGVFPVEDLQVPDIYEGFPDFNANMVGGLILPFFATITSRLFVGYVEDPLIRLMLGGASFVLLKGVCKMYYKQKKYVRYCRLNVKNFITQND